MSSPNRLCILSPSCAPHVCTHIEFVHASLIHRGHIERTHQFERMNEWRDDTFGGASDICLNAVDLFLPIDKRQVNWESETQEHKIEFRFWQNVFALANPGEKGNSLKLKTNYCGENPARRKRERE